MQAPAKREVAARQYLLLWANQLAASAGTTMTAFALSVWIYEHTSSISQFTLTLVAGTLPGVLMAPFSGRAADRFNTKRVLLACDLAILLGLLFLAWAAIIGRLSSGSVYAGMVYISCCMAFRMPAALVLSRRTLPAASLGRISGLLQLADAVTRLGMPALAGAWLQARGLASVMMLTVAGFTLAPLAGCLLRSPPLAAGNSQARDGKCGEVPAYLWRERTLFALFTYGALVALVFGLVSTLYRPMLLARHSVQVLGIALSAGGLGMLTASVLVAALGVRRRTLATILLADMLLGATVAALGLANSPYVTYGVMFASMFCVGLSQSHTQTLWLKSIPLRLQGRFFALNALVANSCAPAAALLGGVLADRWFEPWLAPGGLLASSVGLVLGVGPGRGLGFMFMLTGTVTAMLAGAALFVLPRPQQGLEQEACVTASEPVTSSR